MQEMAMEPVKVKVQGPIGNENIFDYKILTPAEKKIMSNPVNKWEYTWKKAREKKWRTKEMNDFINSTQDGTGSRTVTWFDTITWPGATAPTLTTTLNKSDVFGFMQTGTSTYDGYIIGQNL